MSNNTETTEEAPSTAQPIPHVSWFVLRPGYWRSRRSIARFKRFQHLVIHREHWGSHFDLAPPLEKLIGKKAAKNNPSTTIDTEMHKLMPLIITDLQVSNVHHLVQIGEKKRTYSLVADFDIFPEGWHRQKFDALMQRLNMGIGMYEARKHQAMLDWFNPIFWAGRVVRIPEEVLEYAGLIRTSEQHSAFIKVYTWLVRVLFLTFFVVLLAWIGSKFGLKLPWDVLTRFLN